MISSMIFCYFYLPGVDGDLNTPPPHDYITLESWVEMEISQQTTARAPKKDALGWLKLVTTNPRGGTFKIVTNNNYQN